MDDDGLTGSERNSACGTAELELEPLVRRSKAFCCCVDPNSIIFAQHCIKKKNYLPVNEAANGI